MNDPHPYLVIDLSAGAMASHYPISYLKHPPAGGWNRSYKTTKLVLRKIYSGSYLAGSPKDEIGRAEEEIPHCVKLTHDFYLGVFEITQQQWQLVMGDTNGAFLVGDKEP